RDGRGRGSRAGVRRLIGRLVGGLAGRLVGGLARRLVGGLVVAAPGERREGGQRDVRRSDRRERDVGRGDVRDRDVGQVDVGGAGPGGQRERQAPGHGPRTPSCP